MADSEHSRILPAIMRRHLLSMTAASLFTLSQKYTEPNRPDLEMEIKADPSLIIWWEWYAAHQRRSELCKLQQKLEGKVLKTVGSFPHVELEITQDSKPVYAYSVKEIDLHLSGNDMASVRLAAKAPLKAIRRRWDEVDKTVGYSAARAEENKAAEIEEDLARALWKRSTRSLPSVIAKLHSLIEMEDPDGRLNETPWPELRLILEDLLNINGTVPQSAVEARRPSVVPKIASHLA